MRLAQFIFFALCLLPGMPALAVERLPNIVIIFADDLGYGDVGCFNRDAKVSTPHLDLLAEQGMRFTDAHAAGNWCSPSRYGLLTGRYPWRNKRPYDKGLIEPGRQTLATLLQGRGYRTAMVGKWHLGFEGNNLRRDFTQPIQNGPADHGFDSFFGMHASLDISPYYFIDNRHVVAAPTEDIMASSSPDVTEIQGAFWRAGKASPGFRHIDVLKMFQTRATDFISEQARSAPARPFFLYLALTAPHTPWLPDAAHQGHSRCGPYGDFVQQVDDLCGNILQSLKTAGVADNTLVIFTSDNGPTWFAQDVEHYGHRAAGPLRGMKMDLWEGGHRMPFIARWPGHVPPGRTSDQLICFTDMLATFAAIVGEKPAVGAGEDSINVLPLLLGQTPAAPVRQTLIIDGRMIRKGPWKWIQGKAQGNLARFGKNAADGAGIKNVLYNLVDDPAEQHDVQEQHPQIVKELSGVLKAEAMQSPE